MRWLHRLVIVLAWVLLLPIIVLSAFAGVLLFGFCLITYPVVWIFTGKDSEYVSEAFAFPISFVFDNTIGRLYSFFKIKSPLDI